MSSDHEAEIRASVAAHQDLGSGYDEAVAEGLVERIGAEIDKRIDARLGSFGTQYGPVPGAPGVPGTPGAPGTGPYWVPKDPSRASIRLSISAPMRRSAQRRVGKECRSRW